MAKRKEKKPVPERMGAADHDFNFTTTDHCGKEIVITISGVNSVDATRKFSALRGPRAQFTKVEAA